MLDDQREAVESTEEQGVNRLAWFITGALIGVTVGFLYSPKSGSETRQFLADKSQEGKDAVTETSKDIVDNSREMFERGRQVVEDAAALFDRARKLVRG